MSHLSSLAQSPWFQFLDVPAQELIQEAFLLLAREKRMPGGFKHYSFIVFPMAKAYESFLKKYLKTLGILSEQEYYGRKFRIGRALNPDISSRYKDDQWFFDDIATMCSPDVARDLWDTWIVCRNHVFHYFVDIEQLMTLPRSEKLLLQMQASMDQAFSCAIENKPERFTTA